MMPTNSKNMKNQLFFLIMLTLIVMLPNAMAQSEYIPSWVKNNAGWWADDQIPDSVFITGIEFLINEKIILLNSNSETISNSEYIPSWIKNNAGWWADDQIPDSAFIDGIEFLINGGIIQLETHSESELHNYLLHWNEIVDDAKYAYDGSIELKKIFFKNPDVHLTTKFVPQGYFHPIATYDFIDSGIGMYQLTGDELYLNQARNTASELENNFLSDKNLILWLDPTSSKFIDLPTSNQELLFDISNLALLDSNYNTLVKKMADEIIENEINPETNLFYTSIDYSGSVSDSNMYISYASAYGLDSLLRAYEVTSDEIYLTQVKNTLRS